MDQKVDTDKQGISAAGRYYDDHAVFEAVVNSFEFKEDDDNHIKVYRSLTKTNQESEAKGKFQINNSVVLNFYTH